MTALMLAAALLSAEPKQKSRVTEITFGEDVLTGTTKGPDLLDINTYKPPKFGNLIKVRENFDDKIVRSVDQM